MKTIWESDGIDEPVLICCPPKAPATGLQPKKPQTDKPLALEMPAIEAREPSFLDFSQEDMWNQSLKDKNAKGIY